MSPDLGQLQMVFRANLPCRSTLSPRGLSTASDLSQCRLQLGPSTCFQPMQPSFNLYLSPFVGPAYRCACMLTVKPARHQIQSGPESLKEGHSALLGATADIHNLHPLTLEPTSGPTRGVVIRSMLYSAFWRRAIRQNGMLLLL